MRYLLINEFREMGGTEVQSLRERDLLRSKGHDVMYLTMDPNYPLMYGQQDCNVPIHYSGADLLRYRFMVDVVLKRELDVVISGFQPDIIHLNNVIKSPPAVYKCVKAYPCFQTIRDYGAVCPKSTCVKKDYSLCKGFCYESCRYCIGANARLQFKNLCLPRLTKARLGSVDLFVCPSNALARYCTANRIPAITVNNPFDFGIVVKKVPCMKRTFLYYGGISEIKGITPLLEAWREFVDTVSDAYLYLVGKVAEEYRQTFETLLAKSPNVRYLGSMSNAAVMELYKRIYCVVVPSLWIENYPNTVLEAMANKTLVIGSNRGGIPELIQSDEFLFDVLSRKSIINALRRAYNLEEQDYMEVTERAYKRCRQQNALETYYDRVLDVCNNLIQTKEGLPSE